ncbi:MAG TPA: FCD domain-containing protein, partial [Bryobacteraceae bacterium]
MLVTSQLVELEHTLAFHKPIFNAIKQRDAELARKLMTDHLNDANNLLLRGRQRESERVLQEHLRTKRPSEKPIKTTAPRRLKAST